MMAAIAPPIAPAGAPAATVVTIAGTILGNDLALTFPATDQYVVSYPMLPWVFSVVIAGGAPQTASIPIGLAIRTWGAPLTLNNPAARTHALTISVFTFALTDVAFSRVLTELAASDLLRVGPFEYQRDADAALCALTVVNHANLALQLNDFLPLESFNQAATAAVAAIAGGRGRGRGRGQGPAIPAVPAQAAVPGPLNLAFVNMCSMVDFADAQVGPCPLMTFVRLLGALGEVATRASRLQPQSPAHRIAHALRSSAAISSGVDAATAAPPAGDSVVSFAIPQTIDSAFDALTVYLTLDKITSLGLATELRDALVSARGDQAQCDAITIRRLHLIGDRYASQPSPTALTPRHTRPWSHGLTVARGTGSRPTGPLVAAPWPLLSPGIDL